MTESRHIWRPHVTVATVVHDGDRFLMVEEDIHGQRRYNQPAGHLEPDESLACAAVRETLEETCWHVALDHFIGVYQWWSPVHHDHVVRFAFSGHALNHDSGRVLDTGICRAVWMRRDEIAALGERQLRSPLVLKSIDAWLGGRRLPLTTLQCLLPQAATTP